MKTLNKIFLGTFTIAAIAFMGNGCTPSAMPYPPGHGCLLGNEFAYRYHDDYADINETSTVNIKLFTDLRIHSMERRMDFTDYAFMFIGKVVPTYELAYGNVYVMTGDPECILQHAQTFKCSVSEDSKTIVLSYVDPSELPEVLNDPVEYKDYILDNYYTDDFDLSSKLFINEGEIVLKAADYEDEGKDYTRSDFVLEWDGKEYILENR